MTRAAGDGPGRRGPAGTAIIDPAELGTLDAPARLARALTVTGNNVAAASRLLRQAGYPVSITAGRNDLAEDGDGLWAPHPVNITTAGWSYSAAGSPGHDKCCAARTRGVYQGQRLAGRLPYEHARVMVPEGRVPLACYLLSVAPGGPRVIVTYDDIDRGRWAHRLGMALSRDRTIRDAVVTVLLELINSLDLPERPHALTPSTRTPDGRRVPVPEWSTLPPGYGDQPATPEADRLAHRGALADVAADCPQAALLLGASAGAPLAAATRVQSCGWELVAAPRTGKTTTMQAIAAVWGNPSLPPDPGIMMSWDATSRGMGRLAGMLGTIPFIADETGTADFDPAEWARFQYGMAQGGARTLSTQDAGMKRTGGWAGCWFTSGNGSIAENRSGKFAGIAARVITLTGPFTTSAGQACQLRDATAGDYGYLGPAVLEAVDVDQFRAWHAAARESIGAPEGGVLGTTGDQLAAAVAGAMGLDLVLGTGNRLAAAAARAARDYLAVTAEPEPDRDRQLRALAECLSSNRPAWPDRAAYEALGQAGDEPSAARLARHGYAAQLDGLRDDEWLYVYRATWDRLIAEQGIAATLVLRELHDRGDLAVPDGNRAKGEWTSHAPRWARRVSVYKVRLSALDTTGGDDDGQDPGPGQSPAREILTDTDSRAPDGGDPWAAEAAAMDAYRQAELPAPAAAEYVAPAPPVYVPTSEQDPAPVDRAAWLAAARNRRPFTSDDQWAEFERRAALLDAPDIGDHPERLGFLDALDGKGRKDNRGRVGGPFAPLRARRSPLFQPWGRDGLPPAVSSALVVSAWAWKRDGYSGPAVVLDRTAAWAAGLASATFAHGALTQTGPWDGTGAVRPGYYLVTVYQWLEQGMPSPLGKAEVGTQVWVPAPTMGLLRELAEAGRWPDGEAADSWTGEPCRLTEWAGLRKELGRYAIEVHGRDGDAYGAVKVAFGMAMSLLKGDYAKDTTMPRKVWPKCFAQRIDWPDHAESQAAVTMWRTADACARLTGPELAPVAVGRNTDELVIPAAALDVVTRDMLPGKARPPVTLDPLGITLGTFKVKGREDW